MIDVLRRFLRLEHTMAHLRPWNRPELSEKEDFQEAREQAKVARKRADIQVEQARKEMHWLETALTPNRRPLQTEETDKGVST